MKLPKLGRIGTAVVLFVVLAGAGTAIGIEAIGSSSPRATSRSKTSVQVLGTRQVADKTYSPECVNSFDSKCGAFYWDPAPSANAPLTVSVTPTSASAAVGEPVSFTATATDPDASIACDDVYYGDGVDIGSAARLRRQFGRWVPPAKQQGQETKTYSHTFDKAGTYTVIVNFHSGDNCSENYNPYSSDGHATLTITVH